MALEIAGDLAPPLPPAVARPTLPLPLGQLINLNAYWLGITAIWAGLGGAIIPKRMEDLFGLGGGAIAIATITAFGVVMPIVVQPTVGVISDYTTTRWGRRKPYILIGAVLDVIFLCGIALSQPFVLILVFYVLLQFSSNFAQGPFQGYMPDLVPEQQVARASGVIGMMIVGGQLAGVAIAALGPLLHPAGTPAETAYFWPTIGLGFLELITALVLIVRVQPGPAGLDPEGRTKLQLGRLAWGTDVLQLHSFVWLVFSRMLFLAATGIVTTYALYYLEYAMGMDLKVASVNQLVALAAIVIPVALTVLPAASLSDRVGRKHVIFGACGIGAAGLTGVALAPTFPLAVVALIPVGVAAGAFLAVDWALMTDIIPKVTTGRYMGISNVGTALAGPLGAIFAGGVIWVVANVLKNEPLAPRAGFLVGAAFFIVAAICLRPVDPTPRD